LDSAKYEAYGGGHGTAAAIFWDLCIAPGDWDLQDAFHPKNAVSLMAGPLAGTGPSFAGRTSVSGLSPQSWPVDWFCHSNFGGSFAPMLKMAGSLTHCRKKPENESKLSEMMQICLPIFALFFSNYIQLPTNKDRICL
jgi:hypothetical protein